MEKNSYLFFKCDCNSCTRQLIACKKGKRGGMEKSVQDMKSIFPLFGVTIGICRATDICIH